MKKRSERAWNRVAYSNWRDFQKELKRRNAPRKPLRIKVAIGLVLVLAGFFGIHYLFREVRVSSTAPGLQATNSPGVKQKQFDKTELRSLLKKKEFNDLTTKSINLRVGKEKLHVETSLDVGLQKYLLDRLDRRDSRAIGIVVMDPETGRVLAMAGFDRAAPSANPCLRSDFPSASVFKIVTAAAAVEHCGLRSGSPMNFCGGRYTLYKRQLRNRRSRYSTTVSLKQAFAQSIDPIFGKLGERRLGGPLLLESAAAFGFNEPISFDLPVQPSRFHIDEQPYHLAELASGFNRETTISPLHGAVMVSAVLNEGRMVAPSIVDRIVGAKGRVLYRLNPTWVQQAMSAKAAAVLNQMMQATINSGTCRQFFRHRRRDKVLSRLVIGGKTGTIGNRSHDALYDWFVGFAKARHGGRQMVVAVMVEHGKYLGIHSTQYARMAIRYYFSKKSI